MKLCISVKEAIYLQKCISIQQKINDSNEPEWFSNNLDRRLDKLVNRQIRKDLDKKTTPDKPRVIRQQQGTYTRVKENKNKYNRKRIKQEDIKCKN